MGMLQVVAPPRSGEKRRREAALPATAKRTRFLSDFDVEEMLCTVLTITEDLSLLLNLTKDICLDTHCRQCNQQHQRAPTVLAVQAMCKDLYDVLKYILEKHYIDFAQLGMDHLVLAVRHQFVQFMLESSLN
ncbi:hypothetical protein SPRG_14931 [Saprolegnia parasitica CBS 223.65]|uniref:Uncharacterized protein n=1 Tax=Saprolegnia parasitica (strain CBS 223.65) TaxID=695850 RepID=A0A067BZU9_SAPPC|nr:hypothetical protein SPRG_14931 [Saprolegnia parasitica CBS 223.65]KDO19831.1 hypothetical protein SPRG_14931 [Saprolegnia parasitica CBS 223.65]|eukprot:XP_012209443.1 hypothetical protein SPRG_14931 [Saprolegnia parasitica CBS 223.65]